MCYTRDNSLYLVMPCDMLCQARKATTDAWLNQLVGYDGLLLRQDTGLVGTGLNHMCCRAHYPGFTVCPLLPHGVRDLNPGSMYVPVRGSSEQQLPCMTL